MEVTPQSAHSPTSPFRYTSHSSSSTSSHNPQPLYEYPSPAQSEYRSSNSLHQGLGLYSCPTLTASNDESSGSVADAQSPPLAATNNIHWPAADIHRDTPRSSHSTPNLLSAEYDPWVSFSSAPSFSHDIYGAQTAEAILPVSPVPSGKTSQRSSVSSAPVSDILTQAGSIHSFTPRIKMEDHTDYAVGNDNDSMMLGSPQLSHGLLVTAASSYGGSLDATYYQEQSPMAWSKMEYGQPPDLPSISSLAIPRYDRRSESRERRSSGSKKETSTAVQRTRQPRKLTTKEDANFQCSVKGCEKFFGRSYNFKAHMETHDTSREYPFPCPLKDCNKKFVRKTDLQRHHQSVHEKQRTHRCDYCSRLFARKDTLRRRVSSLSLSLSLT